MSDSTARKYPPTMSGFLQRFLDFFRSSNSLLNTPESFGYTLRKMALIGVFDSVGTWAEAAKRTISAGKGIPVPLLEVYMNGILNAMAVAEQVMLHETASAISPDLDPTAKTEAKSETDEAIAEAVNSSDDTSTESDSDSGGEQEQPEEDAPNTIRLDAEAFDFILKKLKQ